MRMALFMHACQVPADGSSRRLNANKRKLAGLRRRGEMPVLSDHGKTLADSHRRAMIERFRHTCAS